MKSQIRAMVLAAFAGDALALGVHWIYSAHKIKKLHGRISRYVEPAPDSYHPARRKGDLTHYGDQTLILLEYLAATGRFDAGEFSSRWMESFRNYDGYMDDATRTTIENLKRGVTPLKAGSPSADLAGAARIAPLIYLYHNDPQTLVRAARQQTALTHADSRVEDAAEFFALTCLEILKGLSPSEACLRVAGSRFDGSDIKRWTIAGIDSAMNGTADAIRTFGRSCHITEAFAGVIHLVSKYQDNLEEALVQAVMAGGDNAARAMLTGMLLGVRLGMPALPGIWIDELHAAPRINLLLNSLKGE